MNETQPHEMMPLAEIEAQFDNKWILVEDPEFDANDELIRGKVLYHGKSRDEMYRKDAELHLRSAAYLYTGPALENILVNL